MNDAARYTLEQLAVAADVPLRTARFYIQKGLLARPHGSTRAAWYDAGHLDALVRIRQWSAAGLSLGRIAELLTHGETAAPAAAPAGHVDVRTHLQLAEGLELVIRPDVARLSPERLRALVQALQQTYSALVAASTEGVSDD